MTGAIATVVGMSALFNTPTEAGRPIAAPPSSLQRSVRVEVAVHRRNRVKRIETARPISAPARPGVVSRRVVIVRKHRSQPPRRSLASTQRKPRAPVVASQPTVAPPPVEPAPPETVAPATDQNDGKHGHAYGHDKEHKHGSKGHEE
jgi:hypothetical protein